jgi:tetratricopeptide (TPR) repeat protein
VIATLVLLPLAGQVAARNGSRYEIAAKAAFDSRDFDAADVYYRALIQLYPQNEAFRYNLARAAEARGERELASRLMAGLAPRDSTGYAPAHCWQAENLMRSPDGGQAALEAAEAHLLRAVESRSLVANKAHAMLGDMYLGRGLLKQASEHFEKAARTDPQWWIVLARVHIMLGLRDQSRKEAEKAFEHYGYLEVQNLDDHDARLHAAEALVFLERFDEAAAMLDKGLKVSNDPRYPSALGTVYLTWSDALRREPNATVADQQIKMLQAFEYDPTNRMLLRRVINGLKTGGTEAEISRGFIQVALKREKWLDIVNLLLAIEASDRGYNDTAQSYLQRARELNPRAPRMMAELARMYLNMPPFDIQQATQLTEMGLKAWPQDSDLLAVRGYTLTRSGQWIEAVFYLEAALKLKSDDPNLHRLIADAYQQIGRTDKADEHRRRAERLTISAKKT